MLYSTPSTPTMLVPLPSNMVARRRRPRPYTYPTPTVHHRSTVSCRNTWYVDQSTLTTHPSGHLFHHPFVPRPYTSHWRDYYRYCNGWGWFGGTTSIFVDKSYIFYIRMRVDLGQYNILWHKPTPTIHHTTIKWGRSAVSMGGWRGKAVYLRYQARFSIFWYIKYFDT